MYKIDSKLIFKRCTKQYFLTRNIFLPGIHTNSEKIRRYLSRQNLEEVRTKILNYKNWKCSSNSTGSKILFIDLSSIH